MILKKRKRMEGYLSDHKVKKEYYINNRKLLNLKNNPIHVMSFFSGCGGFCVGAKLAGLNVISTLDNNEDCVNTLKSNQIFENCHHFHEDINKISKKDFKIILKKNKTKKFIITAGPPCQPFSKAAYWITNKKRLKDKDPRNLFPSLFKTIKNLKPDGFVIENVESLLHPSNHKIVNYIEKQIKNLKYNFKKYKINSVNFGVPQKRKRIFYIASKKQIYGDLEKINGNEKEILINNKLQPYEKVIDWIGKYDKDKYSDNYDSIEGRYFNELIKIPKGKNYIALTKKADFKNPRFVAGKRYWTFLLKLDPNKPSWTIISNPGHWEGPFHWKNRRLRIKELAAIQTFPADYNFIGSRRSIQKQIGNSTPPILIKHILGFLRKNI